MTPPRTSGFGPLSWLWWPLLFIGWATAAVVMVAERAARAAREKRPCP